MFDKSQGQLIVVNTDGCCCKDVTVCVSVLSLVELPNLRLLFAGGGGGVGLRDFCPLFGSMINLNRES